VNVCVLDHGMGNLRSVAKAFEAAGATVSVSADPAHVARCDALCVPGQGIFGRCMSGLAELGLTDLVRGWVADERPYLGICLGMQVLYDRSEEGDQPGLGVLPGRVTRLPNTVPVPHMGWNTVNETYFYFDHSFAAQPDEESTVTGWCEHGARFAARVDSGSITGVQFHPEKSGPDGIALLKEWIADS